MDRLRKNYPSSFKSLNDRLVSLDENKINSGLSHNQINASVFFNFHIET